MNNTFFDIMNALNAVSNSASNASAGGQNDAMVSLAQAFACQFFGTLAGQAAGQAAGRMMTANSEAKSPIADDVNSGLGVYIPPTQPLAVQSPTASIPSAMGELKTPSSSTSSAVVEPSTSSAVVEPSTSSAVVEPSPSSSSAAVEPRGPDLYERPRADYASPGGHREQVWQHEEKQDEKFEVATVPDAQFASPESRTASRASGSPNKRPREDPQFEQDWFSFEALKVQLENGGMTKYKNVTPTEFESIIGMIGVHHNLNLSEQAIKQREKMVNEAPVEIAKCQAILADAPRTELLGRFCRAGRKLVNSKK